MQSREIISLQVGGFANWVGTHCWNLDSELRETPEESSPLIATSGSFAAPRLVCFDLRGRQGSLFAETTDAQEASSSVAWGGGVVTHVSEAHPLNEFLPSPPCRRGEKEKNDVHDDDTSEEEAQEDEDLFSGASVDFAARARLLLQNFKPKDEDESPSNDGRLKPSDGAAGGVRSEGGAAEEEGQMEEVDSDGEGVVEVDEKIRKPMMVWSDFLEVHLKESSYCEVPVWDVRNGAFSAFSAGDMAHSAECVLPVEWRDDALDRIRRLLEGCDSPQGFNLTVDACGGFGGLATSLAAEAREQCRSAAIHATLLVDPPDTLPTDSVLDDEEVFDSRGRKRNARRALDHALSLHSILEHASQILPLNSLSPHPSSTFLDGEGNGGNVEDDEVATLRKSDALMAESARLGLCLDTATLPYRFGAAPGSPLASPTSMSWRKAVGMRDWVSALCPRADLRVLSCMVSASPSTTRGAATVFAAIPPQRGSSGGGSPLITLTPWFPSVLPPPAASVVHWSRVLVGRGCPEEQWSDERALCFTFAPPALLPRSFPRASAAVPPDTGSEGSGDAGYGNKRSRADVCVSLGCNGMIAPWLASISEPLLSRTQVAVAARRSSDINSEDASAMAEAIIQLSDSYTQ